MEKNTETAIALTHSQTDIFPAPTFSPEVSVVVDKKKINDAPRSALNVSLDYHEFVMGEPVRGIFLGLTPYRCVDKASGEEVILTGAVFVTDDGAMKVNCAVKFVTTLSMFSIKTAFEATFIRTKKTGNGGNMQIFDIRPLAYKAEEN